MYNYNHGMKKHDSVGSPDASNIHDASNLPLHGCPSFREFLVQRRGIVMTLTIYYDGQFWVGVIETQENGNLKAYRYVFGTEPSDAEVLEFVNYRLLAVITKSTQLEIKVKRSLNKRINPKRLQRQVAKEMKKKGISTQAQEAIKEEIESRKIERKKLKKQRDDAFKQKQWEIKKQKAKQKHKGR